MSNGLPYAKRSTFWLADAARDEFVYGGHLLALGDTFTLWALGLVAGIPVTWDFLVIVYLCVFSGNLYNRRAEAEHDRLGNGTRTKVMAKYIRAYYPIAAISLTIVALLLMRFADFTVLLSAAGLIAVSLLYTVALKPLTRYIVGFKSYAGALMYALMVPFMAIYYGRPIGLAVLLAFAFYCVRIFISNAACDVKDTASDRDCGLKTFAVHYGSERTTRILGVVNVLSAIPIVVGIFLGTLPTFAVALLLTIPFAAYYLKPNRSMDDEALSSIVIDGEFLLWLPLVLIARALF